MVAQLHKVQWTKMQYNPKGSFQNKVKNKQFSNYQTVRAQFKGTLAHTAQNVYVQFQC
jgi:hypothetical protein